MGKRRRRGRQPSMWVSSSDLPRSAGHPFYERLNRVLDAAGFDACRGSAPSSMPTGSVGRVWPGPLLPDACSAEGLDSERAIAWRAADSLSLRQFLDVSLDGRRRTTRRCRARGGGSVETHLAVFTWVLQRLGRRPGRGQDGRHRRATLEANAALRSIVRRDTGAGYETFLRQLAAASGIATPTRAELARLDRKRPKKGSNDDWTHPKDPREDHEDEGRQDALGAQGRACRGPGDGRGGRRQCPGRGCGRHPDDARDAGHGAAEQVDAVLPAGPGIAELTRATTATRHWSRWPRWRGSQLRVRARPGPAQLAREARRP